LFEQEEIPGLILITPDKYDDDRGYFSEVYNLKRYSKENVDVNYLKNLLNKK